METLFLHTTRGMLSPKTLDEARHMHNAFVGAGSQPGIDIARSLGDMSHSTYIPVDETGKRLTTSPGELLFIDWWTDPNGMEQFFANPFAQEAGSRLFSERVEAEWMPVPAAFTFQVPAKADARARFVKIMQAPVRVVSDATTALAKLVSANLRVSRRFGHLSHQLFLRQANVVTTRPASNARHNGGQDSPLPTEPVELLAVDFWPTLEGLREYENASTTTNGLDEVLTGPVAVSVWEQVCGFIEW